MTDIERSSTTSRGQSTYQEILSQPEVWAQTLADTRPQWEALRSLVGQPFDEVLFIGCGSTYYLSLAAAALFQRMTGRCARGLPSSELWFYPDVVLNAHRRTLLVAVSRSGTTTETVRAIETFKAHHSPDVLAVTCYPDTPMAQAAHRVLAAPAAQEQSIAQTRSFVTMYLLTQVLAGLAADDQAHLAQLDRLSEAGQRLLDRHAGLAEQLGTDFGIDRVFFLGTGIYYGLACEAMLKMKEMSLTYAEAFHFMEFRHGPKSMVNEQTLVVGLLSDSVQEHEIAVLREMRSLGARVLALADESAADTLQEFDFVVPLCSDLPETARGALYMPLLQLMAYHRSMAKGLDPDHPHNLDAVVYL